MKNIILAISILLFMTGFVLASNYAITAFGGYPTQFCQPNDQNPACGEIVGGGNWNTIGGNQNTVGVAGFNWQSAPMVAQSYNINWSNINGLAPINSGGINWNNIPSVATGSILTQTGGVNGGVNWSNNLVFNGVTSYFMKGNVGIGTTTPGATLDVIGNIRASYFTGVFSNRTPTLSTNNVRYAPALSFTSGSNGGQAATLIADTDPAVLVFSQSSGTVGYRTGEYIQDLQDNSGYANYWVQTNSTYWQYNPILQAGLRGGTNDGINGRPAVIFPSYNSSMQNTTSNFVSNFDSGFTWIFVVGWGYLQNNWVALGQTGFYVGSGGSGHLNQLALVAGGTTYLSPTFAEPVAVVAVTLDTTNSTVRITINNSTNTYTYTGSSLPTTGTFNLGNSTSNGTYFPGPMGRVLMYNAPLTLTNTTTIMNGLANDYGIYLPIVVTYGDSFATGQSAVTEPYFGIPQQVANDLNSVTQYLNGNQNFSGIQPYTQEIQNWSQYPFFAPYLGYSGYTTWSLYQSAQINPMLGWLSPQREANVVNIIGEPTNSMCGTGNANTNYNETPAQALADIETLGLAIKAANPGTLVVANTVLPRGSGGCDSPNATGTFETRRLAYNTLLLAAVSPANGIDAVADVASLAQFAGPVTSGGALPNGTTYQPDGVHPGNLGSSLYAQVDAQVIKNLINANYK